MYQSDVNIQSDGLLDSQQYPRSFHLVHAAWQAYIILIALTILTLDEKCKC